MQEGIFDTSDVQILMFNNLLGFFFSSGMILSSESVKGKGVCTLFFLITIIKYLKGSGATLSRLTVCEGTVHHGREVKAEFTVAQSCGQGIGRFMAVAVGL